ncbi:hypothetical protein R1flu_028411 [Riccia fluitans]|uniref:Cyclin N-terminal domain-containing protein n=1 Tax=Riccia fluitans TaxID=41844 RepID=A0ABD1XQM5_9MARC
MSGMRRRNSRQSDVPPEEWPSQCRRRATSSNYELPHDEAMETIHRLVQPRNEGWFIDDLVFFSSLGREDGKLLDMHAKLVIRQALKWIRRPSSLYTSTTLVLLALAHVDPKEPNLKPDYQFLARVARQNQEGPLLLGDEPWNAFGDTQAQWDAERCELVCERDQLKEDLFKAQEVLADVAQ